MFSSALLSALEVSSAAVELSGAAVEDSRGGVDDSAIVAFERPQSGAGERELKREGKDEEDIVNTLLLRKAVACCWMPGRIRGPLWRPPR